MLNLYKNIYTCKHPETLYTCANNTHYLVQNFPYLIPTQNNFYNSIYVCTINKL
jgi:hypothetical protein